MQEDIGTSARFKGVSADVSLFNNNIRNYIYLTMLVDGNGNPVKNAQGNKTYQYQQASAQLYGAEFWMSIHPEKLSGLSFDNSLAVVYGLNRKANYKGEGTNGEYLPLIPPLKWLSSLSNKFQPDSKCFTSITPKIELELAAKQKKYLALNDTETTTPAYVLFNCGFSTVIKYSKTQMLQFHFQINNLQDKAYQSNLSRLKYFEYYMQSPSAHLGMYNTGQNICLKIILPF